MHKINYKKKYHGVSLVELVLSIAVLSILCVFVIQMFLKSNELNDKAKALDQSVVICESIFELIEGDSTLNEVYNSSLFKFAVVKKNQGDSETTVYMDEDWKPVNDVDKSTFQLVLITDEMQVSDYTQIQYTIKVGQNNQNEDVKIIYEIQMDEYF